MRSKMLKVAGFIVVLCLLAIRSGYGQESFAKKVGVVPVGPVAQTAPLMVPFIFWGGDMATFYANGGLKTQPGTIFDKLGLDLQLVPGDDFYQQVRDYLQGKSPFLRGTYSMIGMASEVIGADPRSAGVVIMQMTWSAGDHMVARPSIQNYLKDLKGKTIVLQAGGPHVGLLDDILKNARLKWDDVKIIWAADLTGTSNSPPQMFRSNPAIDACFVVTPDMIGLCGGLKSQGSGKEGTVKDAHVATSTATEFQRSIADIYVCRKDFYDANKGQVTKFVAGYLQACEAVEQMRDGFEAKRNTPVDKTKYMQLLKLSQEIYTPANLPTLEQDAHGLLMDSTFVKYPGNWMFFTWGKKSLVGFDAFNEKSVSLAVELGNATFKRYPTAAPMDFDSPLFATLKDRTKPTPQTSIVESDKPIDFGKLGKETGIEFPIYFPADEMEFRADRYKDDYDRVMTMLAQSPSCVFKLEGHADTSMTLSHLIMVGKKKGIITLTPDGKAYIIKTTAGTRRTPFEAKDELVALIKSGAFDGDDQYNPRQMMEAALELSLKRAENVRASITKYAEERGIMLDATRLVPQGKGIEDPVIVKPTTQEEMQMNRRVVFKLTPIMPEANTVPSY